MGQRVADLLRAPGADQPGAGRQPRSGSLNPGLADASAQ